MANIRQLASGRWQVQIRLKGRKATETFIRHDRARENGPPKRRRRLIVGMRRPVVGRDVQKLLALSLICTLTT